MGSISDLQGDRDVDDKTGDSGSNSQLVVAVRVSETLARLRRLPLYQKPQQWTAKVRTGWPVAKFTKEKSVVHQWTMIGRRGGLEWTYGSISYCFKWYREGDLNPQEVALGGF